jgi:hypothetical protein
LLNIFVSLTFSPEKCFKSDRFLQFTFQSAFTYTTDIWVFPFKFLALLERNE